MKKHCMKASIAKLKDMVVVVWVWVGPPWDATRWRSGCLWISQYCDRGAISPRRPGDFSRDGNGRMSVHVGHMSLPAVYTLKSDMLALMLPLLIT